MRVTMTCNSKHYYHTLDGMIDALTELKASVPPGSEIYLYNTNGDVLTSAQMVRTELTDGSEVYDVTIR